MMDESTVGFAVGKRRSMSDSNKKHATHWATSITQDVRRSSNSTSKESQASIEYRISWFLGTATFDRPFNR
jgi:hypothetical protein